MLFNSYEFLFAFLPFSLLVYFLIGRRSGELAIAWLVLASLFFYGWWNPIYLLLILASMGVNFSIGGLLGHASMVGRTRYRQGWLTVGVVFNLGLLGYFKYADFAVATINQLAGTTLPLQHIVLPLAISFFTFQQIAYLVDAHRGLTQEYRFSHYALFVTFFPQLIAGPIVHHRDMLPQFMSSDALKPQVANIAVGLSIFAIGLFKKTVIADGVAQYAGPVFQAAEAGEAVSFFAAWGGALAYTFQLYFDFSGYSDMAIGAARLFGIRLPINFHSPYKATSIVEFWRRWHMTLSRFLRDYLYISLGGNRGGHLYRYRNLMITMVLGGLWHGAGWTFVIWGALHGGYLAVNHAWGFLMARLGLGGLLPPWLTLPLSWAVTFVAVVVGWVFFYAASVDSALRILQGMVGLNGIALPNAIAVRLGELWPLLEGVGFTTFLGGGSQFVATWSWLLVLLPITLTLPNTQQIMAVTTPALLIYRVNPGSEWQLLPGIMARYLWQPTIRWAMVLGTTAAMGVLAMTRISEFLYFQF